MREARQSEAVDAVLLADANPEEAGVRFTTGGSASPGVGESRLEIRDWLERTVALSRRFA